jgi:hypothetical protein
VGLVFSPSAPFTVAERWNGSAWSVQPTPRIPGAYDIDPPGVSCPTSSVCTAVGGYTNDGPKETLAEQWNLDEGSTAAAGGPLAAGGSSIRSCAGLPVAASIASARTAPSPWFRFRSAVPAVRASSEAMKALNGCRAK